MSSITPSQHVLTDHAWRAVVNPVPPNRVMFAGRRSPDSADSEPPDPGDAGSPRCRRGSGRDDAGHPYVVERRPRDGGGGRDRGGRWHGGGPPAAVPAGAAADPVRGTRVRAGGSVRARG